ncbi:hypothetical protein BJ912DRAFT_1057013 [Pholiota molesta]|nr:hypothetical protein BJ912DRAFT_1057013 [Pholiota molesta]
MAPWDIPDTLFPETEETASSHGLIYDLVGLALFRDSDHHFTAQHFSKDHTKIFTYDGMVFQGSPSIEDGAFSPQHSIPKGFRVSAVFYHLRGGWNAQQHFYTLRRSQCDTQYNLSLSGATLDILPSGTYNDPTLKKMEPSDRYWMANPYKSRTVEYISKPPTTRNNWVDVSDISSDSAPESEDAIPLPVIQPSIKPHGPPAVSEFDKYPVEPYELCDTCEVSRRYQNRPIPCIIMTCTLCNRKWHEDCISMESSADNSDFDDTWACPACVNPHKGQWDEAMLGAYILLKPIPSARFYPAQVLGRTSTQSVHVEWYSGNVYYTHDNPPSPISVFTPLECLQAKNRDSLFSYNKEILGTIRWPVRLEEDAVEKHNYQNEDIRKVLEGSYGAILEIMLGERKHPIVDLYISWIKHRPHSNKMILDHQFSFTQQFEPDILPADKSLINSFLAHLSHDTKGAKILVEQHWISNVASVLFRLAILRQYLGRQPCDDEQIFYLAYTGTSYSNDPPDDLYAEAKNGSIIRILTPAEQVASSLKSIDTLCIRQGLRFGRIVDMKDYLHGVQLVGPRTQGGEQYSFLNTTASGMAGERKFISNRRFEPTRTVNPTLNGKSRPRPKARPRGKAKTMLLEEEYRVIKPGPMVPAAKRMRGAEDATGIELRRSKRSRIQTD